MMSHTLSHHRQMHGTMSGQSNKVRKLPVCHDSVDEQVSIIRKEFVMLTGNHFSATILNQLLYWTLRVKDFDLFLEEERTLPILEKNEENSDDPKSHGWIYKTAHELIDETMLGISHPTMRKYLKQLIDEGWIWERVHPHSKWNKTTQYRVNIKKILKDLIAIGHHLPSIYRNVFASLEEQGSTLQQSIPLNEDESVKNDEISDEKSESLHPNAKILHSSENPQEAFTSPSFQREENTNARILHSNTENFHSDVNPLLSNVKNLHGGKNLQEAFVYPSSESEENPKVKILHSNAENLHPNVNDFYSDVKILQSDVSSFHSKVRNLHSNTEIITENINKEHTQDERARKDKNYFDKSFSEEVLKIWNACVSHEGFACVQLTDERRRKIHGLLPLYFENDLNQWQQFCERVSRSPFLMGQGPRRWRVSVDWILVEENLLKVLEGNFDDGKLLDQKIEKAFEDGRTKEVHAVLESIEDPVWRRWCSHLNFSSESRDYVSLSGLKAISNAKFLEVEDDRLVWVGSSDARALSKIEDLRLKILPVVQGTFPHVRTVRTRLMSESDSFHQAEIPDPSRISDPSHQHKGENQYA